MLLGAKYYLPLEGDVICGVDEDVTRVLWEEIALIFFSILDVIIVVATFSTRKIFMLEENDNYIE